MNNLTELKDGWGEPDPPSPTARATARNALMREITATRTREPAWRRRGGRLGWLVGGTVVTAAAVAVAVVLSPAPTGQQAAKSSPSPDELTGQQILLQAADVALAQPEGAGAYWHVEQETSTPDTPQQPVQRSNEWISRRDGVHYSMVEGESGVSQYIANTGFSVGGTYLTLAQVEGLPTNPDALKTWMTDAYLRPPGWQPSDVPTNATNPSPLPPEEVVNRVADGLSRLLWKVPAPPAVRSAALRALATMPNVTNLGAVDGGQALRIFFGTGPADKYVDGKIPPGAGETTLVINLDTATLISSTGLDGTTKILAAGWTDDMPEIIPYG